MKIPITEFKQDYKKSWEYAVSQIYDYQKEVERLNNIINELEKYLKEFTPMAEFGTNRTYIPNDIVLDKLQELKGSDKQ